jgi:hypothetical protein
VSRADGRGAPKVVAHGITAFAVQTSPGGGVVATVEARRGLDAAFRRVVRMRSNARSGQAKARSG